MVECSVNGSKLDMADESQSDIGESEPDEQDTRVERISVSKYAEVKIQKARETKARWEIGGVNFFKLPTLFDSSDLVLGPDLFSEMGSSRKNQTGVIGGGNMKFPGDWENNVKPPGV